MAALVDSGFLFAMLNPDEPFHADVQQTIQTLRPPIYFPVPLVTEVTYLLRKLVGIHAMAEFIDDLATTQMHLVIPEPADYRRSAEITLQYEDAALDFADTLITAIAERLNITTVLTLDKRHFRMIRPRHCNAFDILP